MRFLSTSMLAGLCFAAALPPAQAAPRPLPETLAMSPRFDEPVRVARAIAAQSTGLAPEAHAVLGTESVTWPDGSLGCPAPGMMYTQALVPGFRVRLQGPDGELDVHLDARGHGVLCPAHRARSPLPAGGLPMS